MRITVNNSPLYFDIINDGTATGDVPRDKPTMIVLHGGLGFDHAYLRPGLDPLGNKVRIVYVDLRGQGRSGRSSSQTYTLEQMADDIAEACQLLDIQHPLIFGHSAGGFVAMHLALRHKDLAQALILSGTVGTLRSDRRVGHDSDPKLEQRASQDVVSVAERYYKTPLTAGTVRDFFRYVGPYYAGPDYMDSVGDLLSLSSIEVAMLRHFRETIVPDYDIVDRLHAISCPTLVLVGSYDWVCPPSASREIARRIKAAQLVEFSHSGHFLFSEEPEKFLAVTSRFIQSNAEVYA